MRTLIPKTSGLPSLAILGLAASLVLGSSPALSEPETPPAPQEDGLAPEPPPPGKRGKRGKRGERGEHGEWLNKLGLTEAQKTKMKEIRQAGRDKIRKIHDDIDAKQEEMRKVLGSDAGADKAREVHEQLQALQRQVADAHFESTLAIREVLTPEQRQKFVDSMGKRFKKRMFFGHGPGHD